MPHGDGKKKKARSNSDAGGSSTKAPIFSKRNAPVSRGPPRASKTKKGSETGDKPSSSSVASNSAQGRAQGFYGMSQEFSKQAKKHQKNLSTLNSDQQLDEGRYFAAETAGDTELMAEIDARMTTRNATIYAEQQALNAQTTSAAGPQAQSDQYMLSTTPAGQLPTEMYSNVSGYLQK